MRARKSASLFFALLSYMFCLHTYALSHITQTSLVASSASSDMYLAALSLRAQNSQRVWLSKKITVSNAQYLTR